VEIAIGDLEGTPPSIVVAKSRKHLVDDRRVAFTIGRLIRGRVHGRQQRRKRPLDGPSIYLIVEPGMVDDEVEDLDCQSERIVVAKLRIPAGVTEPEILK